jgi:hypothetical protein
MTLRNHCWKNLTFDTKQVRLLACALLVLALLATMIGPSKVHAQDFADQANSEIFTANYKLQDVYSNVLMKYWNNISSETQGVASNDTNLAMSYLQSARQLLSPGFYNWSLQEACQSLYMAGQCEFRVYFDMAGLEIEKANETISNIPWYLGKPWYAMDILQNATAEYEAQNSSNFIDMPYSDNVTILANLVSYQVYNSIEEQAIPKLFSNSDSAYALASKAENLAVAYKNDQNGSFWTLFSIGVILPSVILFLIGLAVGILKGETVRRRFHAWRAKRGRTFVSFANLSERERDFALKVVETSGAMVMALFTIGAVTGAVLQQVRYVYQFIGYNFEFALPFICAAVLGIFNLYVDQRRNFPDLFDFTTALFTSGWVGFILWLFGLATQYQSLSQNLYYIIPPSYMLFTLIVSFAISFFFLSLLRRGRKMPTKYLSLSSKTDE